MSRTTRLWLLVVPTGLALGIAASTLTLLSDHLDFPRLEAVLVGLTGGSFITAGLIARTRRPFNLTGLLLIAVGFTWFVSAGLLGANNSLLWTIGVSLGAIPAGFLVHLLIAYPSGRLQSQWELILVAAGYVLVSVAHGAHMLVDADPMACDECPSNAFLIRDDELLRDLSVSSVQAVAVAYLLAVVATLVGRWRHSSPAARRALAPILLAGAATLLLFAISVGAQPFSQGVSDAFGWAATVVLVGVPFLFLWGLLQVRLARADISRVLAEEPGGGVQERIRELLRDPTAELLYACAEPTKGYVDFDGRPREAVAEPGRAVTLVDRDGRKLGAILHDEALLEEPELLEQVAAAAGLEIERDQNLFALQASERRSRALLNALPDKMFRVSGDGIILDIQENPELSAPPARSKIGESVYDGPVPRVHIDRMMATGRRALETGELQTIEWDADIEGDRRFAEGRFIPSGENEFFVVIRDVTDRRRQEIEQEALHRVAVAVAGGSQTERIFDLVTAEVGQVLGAHSANLFRYESDGAEAVCLGRWSEPGVYSDSVGTRFLMQGGAVGQIVHTTGRPVRLELENVTAESVPGEHMVRMGVNSIAAAPITLAGRIWGVIAARLTPPHSFPAGAEERLSAFARLVSLALANEEAREQLAASRARLVSAGVEERQRLERNLHDGAQQRLVSTSLSLRLAQAKLASNPAAAADLLSAAGKELGVALEELRELARGIHPAVLTERGLGPALQSLADRAPMPVDLELPPDGRLPGRVEAAAYYVVSEALANVAKYAKASGVTVSVNQTNGLAVVEVVDDGVGGADPTRGSGLRGLTDRVEALEGSLEVDSRPGEGTRIRAEIPCVWQAARDGG